MGVWVIRRALMQGRAHHAATAHPQGKTDSNEGRDEFVMRPDSMPLIKKSFAYVLLKSAQDSFD